MRLAQNVTPPDCSLDDKALMFHRQLIKPIYIMLEKLSIAQNGEFLARCGFEAAGWSFCPFQPSQIDRMSLNPATQNPSNFAASII
jgi:hypothetical protein